MQPTHFGGPATELPLGPDVRIEANGAFGDNDNADFEDQAMTYAFRLPAFAALLLIASPAHAHLGHVGEVAGHSHWIGVAATGAAAALAIAISVFGKKKDAEEKDAEAEAEDKAGDETPAKA